jgi:DNA-binding NarL/FixJ family response regulator
VLSGGAIRVLLADDHAVLRDGLKALLQASAGIEVVALVGNGGDAVRTALDLQPDIAILDITMPGINGIEAAALLRRQCPGTRVIMLSMHSSAEHVHRALEAGAAGYLLKDAASEEIVVAVRAIHAGRTYLGRALGVSGARAPGLAKTTVSPIDRLSARERQVLQLVVEGHSSAQIAALVGLSPKSVDTYRSRLMKKLGVGDVASLVKFAIGHGLTPAD